MTDTPIQDDLALQLADIQTQVAAMDTQAAVEQVSAALDVMYSTGKADARALEAVQDGAQAILDTTQQLFAAFKATLDVARQLREQREKVRADLAELRSAIRNRDRMNPEVDTLLDEIYMEALAETSEYFAETWVDTMVEDICASGPLGIGEAYQLIRILLEGDLPCSHPMWDTLRDFIQQGTEALEQLYTVQGLHD